MTISEQELRDQIVHFVKDGPSHQRPLSEIFHHFEIDPKIFRSKERARAEVHIAIQYLAKVTPSRLIRVEGTEEDPTYTTSKSVL